MTHGSPASQSRATLMVLVSACCFGSIPILITLAIQSGATLVDMLLWRYGIAAVLLVIVSGGITPVRAAGRASLPLLVFAGGGQAAIAFVSLSALKYIPAASSTFLFYTFPAWVALISAVRGVERLNGVRLGALTLSIAGIGLMVGMPGSSTLNPIGVALALTSALMYAMYIPMIDHFGKGLAPAVTSVFASSGAAVLFLVAAVSQGGPTLSIAPTAWICAFVLAVPCTVMAFIIFLKGLTVIGPVRTAITSTIEPFWTSLLGSVVLGQVLGPRTYAGGVLIALAVVLLQFGTYRRAR